MNVPRHVTMRTACDEMLYAKFGPNGFSQFVFEDTSMLVSWLWGATFLAVEPADDDSWDHYVNCMRDFKLQAHIHAGLCPLRAKDDPEWPAEP